jgi:hypothetical protein
MARRTADPAQFALFALADLEPEPEPPEWPEQWAGFPQGPDRGTGPDEWTGPCLYDSPARGLAARYAEFKLWAELFGHFGCGVDSHAWQPRSTYGTLESYQLDRHEPVPLHCELRRHGEVNKDLPPCGHADPYEMFHRHRGACLMRGCDWEGPERGGENAAVEDGMDHAWPGWRDLPPVRRLPDGAKPFDAAKTPRQSAAHKAFARWVAEVNDVYPEFWLENGGPVRTLRAGPGTRHVEHSTPFGGYDLSITAEEAAAAQARLAAPVPDPLQGVLLGACWECDNGGHVCERCHQPGEHGRAWHVVCPEAS